MSRAFIQSSTHLIVYNKNLNSNPFVFSRYIAIVQNLRNPSPHNQAKLLLFLTLYNVLHFRLTFSISLFNFFYKIEQLSKLTKFIICQFIFIAHFCQFRFQTILFYNFI